MTTVPRIQALTGEAGKIFDERFAYETAMLEDRMHRQRLVQVLEQNRIPGLQEWQNYERQMRKFDTLLQAYLKLQIDVSKADHTPPDDTRSQTSSLEHIYE
jgi:hypothetical protein